MQTSSFTMIEQDKCIFLRHVFSMGIASCFQETSNKKQPFFPVKSIEIKKSKLMKKIAEGMISSLVTNTSSSRIHSTYGRFGYLEQFLHQRAC